MLIALLYPEGGRGKTPRHMEFSGERLRLARFVLRYASDLLDPVRSGAISLDNAYEEARIRKGRAETYEARFNALKAAAPDLAEMVTDGPLNLEEAQAALDQRVSEERRRKMDMARLIFPWRIELGRIDDRQRVLCNDFVLVKSLAASLRGSFAQIPDTDQRTGPGALRLKLGLEVHDFFI
jgi:hypothetical protein